MVGFHDLLMEFERGPESALEATVGTFGSFPTVLLQLRQLVPNMVMGQNPVPLVNIKIAGKWMFIHSNMVP